MSLPPEQINIKRRREEEPVDTLYIQSELHQTKRRFTDFVFQRVQIRSGDGSKGSPGPSPAHRDLRSPRSVSAAASGPTGVPMVRATSPGAEFREAKRMAALRKEKEKQLERALHSSPTSTKTAGPDHGAEDDVSAPAAATTTTTSSGRGSPASSASPGMRRFQISRTRSLLRSTAGAGVQKRKGDGAVAVLVEKLRRKPHSRQASMVADAAVRAEDTREWSDAAPTTTTDSRDSSMSRENAPAARPRKRPVVNKAERQWREERKTAIDAAKRNINQALEKEAQTQHQSNWDDESERLAREFEQIALEMEGAMEEDTEDAMSAPSTTPARSAPVMSKPPLKYPPRTPNKLRSGKAAEPTQGGEEPVKTPAAATGAPSALRSGDEVEHEEDSEGEYVYDTYIRKPLPDVGGDRAGGGPLTNPLVDWQRDQDAWFRQKGIDTTRADVGVIVITREDEQYWEHFVEEDDDEDRWDSEDGDSNAENNPANEYPDEDLSWDDEDDDPMAIYHRYRHHAVSDDEEFDLNDSASERAFGYAGRRSHVESDDESW